MSTLHAGLLVEIDRWQIPATHHAALRAAVELHAPIPCGWALCRTPDTHRVCKECGRAINAPCSTIRVVAEQLGVEIEDKSITEKEEVDG